MLVVDETWNHRDVEVAVGDTMTLELSENATTGYRWRMAEVGPSLRILEETFKASTGAAGSGGVRHWTLVAENAGAVAMQVELKRSWQPEPARTFALTLLVQAR